MSNWKQSVIWILTLVFSIASHAAPVPQILQQWKHNEQRVNYRSGDNPNGAMEEKYTPEAGQVFGVDSYWVDADKLDFIFAENASPAFIKSTFFRNYQGKRQVLFPVHPQNMDYYRDLLEGAPKGKTFDMTPSASIRSLFTWDEKNPGQIFFTKLSIDLVLGANRRLIPAEELARSLYLTELLDLIRPELPRSFSYLPEVLAVIPKDAKAGGTLIRTVPPEVLSGQVQLVPFFSLYSPDADQPQSKALIVKMIEKSGQRGDVFIRHLLKDFAREWLDLAIDQGITMEPHGQNLMLELNPQGMPTGRFVHRDFGGFSVDREFRKDMGLKDLSVLPDVHGITSAGDGVYGLETSLNRFFVTILDSFDWRYSEWQREGWVSPMGEGSFRELFGRDLEALFTAKTGLPIHLNGDLERIVDYVRSARAQKVSQLRAAKAQQRQARGLAPLCSAVHF